MTEPKAITETPLAHLRTFLEEMRATIVLKARWADELSALLTDLEAAQQTEKEDDPSRVAPSSTLPSTGSPAQSTNGSSAMLREVERHIDAARAQMNDDVDFADREYHRGLHDAYHHARNLLRAGEAVASRPAAQETHMAMSSNGQESGPSTRQSGFDSPHRYHDRILQTLCLAKAYLLRMPPYYFDSEGVCMRRSALEAIATLPTDLETPAAAAPAVEGARPRE